MKFSILMAVLLLTLTGVQKNDIKLEVGSVLSAKYVPKKNRKLYLTHSAQLRPYIERNVAGIKYIIAYEDKSRVIKYISTNDKKFKSADGLQVDSYIEVKGEQIRAYPGWEVRGPETKDGWETLIGFDSKITVLGGENRVNPDQYPPLQFGQTVKVKIIGFVKGAN